MLGVDDGIIVTGAGLGEGSAIGSAHQKLTNLIPQARLKHSEYVQSLKAEVMEQLKNKDLSELDLESELSKVNLGARTWEGTIKLTSKPRKKDKKGQVSGFSKSGDKPSGVDFRFLRWNHWVNNILYVSSRNILL